MNFEGLPIVDLRRPNEGWRRIGVVHAIAIHHSVSDDDVWAGNDVASVQAVFTWHTEGLGWPGIGYHWMVGDDGTAYYVGDMGEQRAHVYGRNSELIGVCLLGNYQRVEPPTKQIEGTAALIRAIRRHHNRNLPYAGHRDLALQGSGTACPGDQWPHYKDDLDREVNAVAGLTADQALVLYRAQQARLKEFWRGIYLYNGWLVPPELR
jgi:hypothetical protein